MEGGGEDAGGVGGAEHGVHWGAGGAEASRLVQLEEPASLVQHDKILGIRFQCYDNILSEVRRQPSDTEAIACPDPETERYRTWVRIFHGCISTQGPNKTMARMSDSLMVSKTGNSITKVYPFCGGRVEDEPGKDINFITHLGGPAPPHTSKQSWADYVAAMHQV